MKYTFLMYQSKCVHAHAHITFSQIVFSYINKTYSLFYLLTSLVSPLDFALQFADSLSLSSFLQHVLLMFYSVYKQTSNLQHQLL